MKLQELKPRQNLALNAKYSKQYAQLEVLLHELSKRNFDSDTIAFINENVDSLNNSNEESSHLNKLVKEKHNVILKRIVKENRLVPKHYYKSIFLVIGMTAIGLPIGVAIGVSLGNIGLMGVGFPFGIAIGVAIGASLDNKAYNEGRQLDLEVKN